MKISTSKCLLEIKFTGHPKIGKKKPQKIEENCIFVPLFPHTLRIHDSHNRLCHHRPIVHTKASRHLANRAAGKSLLEPT